MSGCSAGFHFFNEAFLELSSHVRESLTNVPNHHLPSVRLVADSLVETQIYDATFADAAEEDTGGQTPLVSLAQGFESWVVADSLKGALDTVAQGYANRDFRSTHDRSYCFRNHLTECDFLAEDSAEDCIPFGSRGLAQHGR